MQSDSIPQIHTVKIASTWNVTWEELLLKLKQIFEKKKKINLTEWLTPNLKFRDVNCSQLLQRNKLFRNKCTRRQTRRGACLIISSTYSIVNFEFIVYDPCTIRKNKTCVRTFASEMLVNTILVIPINCAARNKFFITISRPDWPSCFTFPRAVKSA